MTHQICLTFDDGDTIEIACRPNEDVVSAGLRQGVLIVSDCRSGTCGACRAYLAEGTYDQLLTHSVHALSDEDEEQGWVLSCRLRPRADLVLEFDYPVDRVARLSASRRTARVLRRQQCGSIARLVVKTIAAQAPLAWIAGQHVILHQTKSGVSYPAFPADCAAGGFEIEILLSLPNQTQVEALFADGEMVTLEGPFGDFTLRPGTQERIFLAAEQALPPAIAMLRSLSQQEPDHNTTLIISDIGLEAESSLRALVGANTALRFGLDALTERLASSRSVQLYLCGPDELNETARSILAAHEPHQCIVWENAMNGDHTRS
jgi:methane monooxygenase component C